MRKLSEVTEKGLRDCFSSTVYEKLCRPLGDDIDTITDCLMDCLMDYINVCVDNIIPIIKVLFFSNNKSLINPDIKALFK